MTFYCYPKCSTCRDAAKWLNEHDFTYEYIDIRQNPPIAETLKEIVQLSGLPLKRFFNTSGNSYRELGLAASYDEKTEDELFELLSQDGVLIKRPIFVTDDTVVVGFKPESWEVKLLGEAR